MDFDAVSICARMIADLQNPANRLEGGFCMDNLQAVSEELARLNYMELVPLKAKIAEAKEELITSGNENHYIYWAKKVPGVGNARAVGVRDGSGEVMVAVVTDSAGEPDAELLAKVAAYIEEQRPVGARPIIVGAVGVPVSVRGKVALKPGYSIDEVSAAFRRRLQEHFLQIAFSKSNPNLSYHLVGSMLFEVAGVADVPEYTLNSGMASLAGSFDQYFTLEDVILSVFDR